MEILFMLKRLERKAPRRGRPNKVLFIFAETNDHENPKKQFFQT